MSPTSYQAALPRGTEAIIPKLARLSKKKIPSARRESALRIFLTLPEHNKYNEKPKKMGLFLFILLALISVGSVLAMIVTKNQAYNALFLVLAFASLGGLFGLLNAPFIAVVQIIIYAGAIMVLFIFAIMMINLGEGLPPEKKKSILIVSLVLGLIFLIEIVIAASGRLSSLAVAEVSETGNPVDLGRLLFTKYLYPFEITSILIIAALVGALVLLKKKEKE
jgi:NADH-quinone oxidoreductase subunit J